jgi:hypothetical protein
MDGVPLDSSYSDSDPAVRQQRYEAACAVTVAMLRAGEVVFSPIVYSHPLVADGLRTDRAFWQRVDGDHLLFCDEVVGLMQDGWDRSVGVRQEVQLAHQLGKPIRYVGPRTRPGPAPFCPRRGRAGLGGGCPANERTPRRWRT